MTPYLDSSVVVALLADEPSGLQVRRWLLAQPEGYAVISLWVDVEVSSALAQKRRTGSLAAAAEQAVRTSWRAAQGTLLRVVPTEAGDFTTAAQLCARSDLVLRGPDALHLAIAQRLGFAVATFDRGMAKAARRMGLQLEPVG